MIGRARELGWLTGLVDELTDSGRAVLVSGDAGVGKSTLLTAVADHARSRGWAELHCTGVPSEMTAGFAGLHELLQPVLDRADALPTRQREALLTAFGLAGGPPPDRLVLSLAVLGLLEEVASRRPLVVVVDDLQWLDPSTREIVTFLGRRLSTAPLLLLIGVRGDGNLEHRLPVPAVHLHLEPLGPADSAALLDSLGPPLAPAARRRVLTEAAGNPLALREFAATVGTHGLGPLGPAPRGLPTTRRLEETFLVEVGGLPSPSRQFLLLASAADAELLPELVPAARSLGLTPEDLDPAEAAGLVTLTGNRLRFRHPLLRSAVYGAASWSERARTHRALATTARDAGRAAWHRSETVSGPDESVAAELEEAAQRSLRRGARAEAAAELERAAVLSPDPVSRSRRLAAAAESSRQAGRTAEAERLSHECLATATTAEVLGSLAATDIMLGVTAGIPPRSIGEAVALVERMAGDSGREHGFVRARVLLGTAVREWLYGGAPDEAALLSGALRSVRDTEELLARLGLAVLDPIGAGSDLRRDLPELLPALLDLALVDGVERYPGSSQLVLAMARVAESVQDLRTAVECWDVGTSFFQGSGAVADEAQALTGRAALRVVTGQPGAAVADAERALRLCGDLDLPVLGGLAAAAAACAGAWQGSGTTPATVTLARELSGAVPSAMAASLISWAAGGWALVQRRPADAWTALRGVSAHPTTALWALGDLTEAAVEAGEHAAAGRLVGEADAAARALGSPHLSMLVLRSRALLTDGPETDGLFRAAAEAGAGAGTPLELARTRLAHGSWLRRNGRVIAARDLLGEALHALDAAGAHGWSRRAAGELRAAGVQPAHRGGEAPVAALTAQEREIARLAADGLTNREIADRVYLSHRTVGAHLYRIYPKLGISSRVQLRDVLGDDDA